jgi:uncharacterized coiled-coil protein SlyX
MIERPAGRGRNVRTATIAASWVSLGRTSWFTADMSDLSERLRKIESHFAHLERQYEQLNKVVIEQGRSLARLQKESGKVSQAVENMELERIRATPSKPPHYGRG